MEGEVNPDHIANPEQKDTNIPYFRAELPSTLDSASETAHSLLNCIKGYNHLVHLYKSNASDSELGPVMPGLYRDINLAIYPLVEASPENTRSAEIPDTIIHEGDPITVLEIKDETEARMILSQARIFTHGIGNIAHAVTSTNDINEYYESHGHEERVEPIDVRDRLKANLLHAQELLNNEMIIETVSAEVISSKFAAQMRELLLDQNVDLVVAPELNNMKLNLPIYWMSVLASDLAQNIKRKQELVDTRIQTTVIFTLDETTGMLRIKVEDNGSPYPHKFVDNGFIPGEGENEGGKHIAMAAHSTTAESIEGKVYAWNDFDEDEQITYPQTHILLPLDAEVGRRNVEEQKKKGESGPKKPQDNQEIIPSITDQLLRDNPLPSN